MRLGILGTGQVGMALAGAFAAKGHDVMVGGRTAEAAEDWAREANGRTGTFADAAAHGEVLILAVRGDVARTAVARAGGADGLSGKVLIDVTNPLDFSQGFPPALIAGLHNDFSLGEALQADLPATRVVKALNTMSHKVMVAPEALEGPSDVFLAGDDPAAKAAVARLLGDLGWSAPVDLGGIAAARGLEAWLLFWTRAMGPLGGDGMFNLRLVRSGAPGGTQPPDKG